jgi:hypothetical protein
MEMREAKRTTTLYQGSKENARTDETNGIKAVVRGKITEKR